MPTMEISVNVGCVVESCKCFCIWHSDSSHTPVWNGYITGRCLFCLPPAPLVFPVAFSIDHQESDGSRLTLIAQLMQSVIQNKPLNSLTLLL